MATSITAITGGTPAVTADKKPPAFTPQFKIYTATLTLTDATLPAQTSSVVDVAVPGAALGDFVLVSYPDALGGIVLSGRVKAADTVEVIAFNTESTDAATNLSGGLTAKIVVLRPNFLYT